MLKKLHLFIRNLFSLPSVGSKEEFVADKSYSDVVGTPVSKIKEQMEALAKKNTASTVVEKQQPKKKINRQVIEKRIKTNIYFIEDLMEKMEGVTAYKEYYRKLKELKTQSQNSLKILFRIKEDAPYYYNTVIAIMNHTKVISGLLVE